MRAQVENIWAEAQEAWRWVEQATVQRDEAVGDAKARWVGEVEWAQEVYIVKAERAAERERCTWGEAEAHAVGARTHRVAREFRQAFEACRVGLPDAPPGAEPAEEANVKVWHPNLERIQAMDRKAMPPPASRPVKPQAENEARGSEAGGSKLV